MNVLIIVLSTMVAVNALLLIGLILIQQSKGGGFGGSTFGGTGETVFGAQAGSHLTKLTVIFTAIFFALTLLLAIITGHRQGPDSVVEREVILESEGKADSKPGDAAAGDDLRKSPERLDQDDVLDESNDGKPAGSDSPGEGKSGE